MNFPRHELLSRAALSDHQDRGIGGSHGTDDVPELGNRGRRSFYAGHRFGVLHIDGSEPNTEKRVTNPDDVAIIEKTFSKALSVDEGSVGALVLEVDIVSIRLSSYRHVPARDSRIIELHPIAVDRATDGAPEGLDGQDSRYPVSAAGWLAAAVALLLAVVGFAGWLITARRLRRTSEADRAAPGSGKPGHRLADRRRALQTACRKTDPAAIHRSLLAFLSSLYGVSPAAAAERFRAAGYGPLLDQLNARVYGRTAESTDREFDAAPLLQAVAAMERAPNPGDPDDRAKTDPLPPLYG